MTRRIFLIFLLSLLLAPAFQKKSLSFVPFRCDKRSCVDPDAFVTWPDPLNTPVQYLIDSNGIEEGEDLTTDAEAIAEIKASFQTWAEAAEGGIDLQFDSLLDMGDVGGDRQAAAQAINGNDSLNKIFFVHSHWSEVTGEDAATIGVTIVSYDTLGNILDADMMLNGEDYVWEVVTSEKDCLDRAESQGVLIQDVRNVVTHEVGHFIGIDHSCDDFPSTQDIPSCETSSTLSDATMAATGSTCETKKRDLNSDDISAVTFLYPPSGVKPGANSDLGGTTGATGETDETSASDGGGGCNCAIESDLGNRVEPTTYLWTLLVFVYSLVLRIKKQRTAPSTVRSQSPSSNTKRPF